MTSADTSAEHAAAIRAPATGLLRRLAGSEPALVLGTAIASAWLCVSLPLFSQETYYWTYAQHPDLSYFDHPPMVAWLIWLGTWVCGDGAVGIRLATWLCGMATCLAGLLLLRAFGVAGRGRRLWILLTVAAPGLLVVHVLANPDPPLVCCWAFAMLALWRARDGHPGAWLLAGAASGVALLSKYSAAFLAVSGLLLLLFDPAMRRQLRRPGPYLGVLAAGLLFLPVVIWNVQHDFASFLFQTEHRYEKTHLGTKWLVQCLAGQVGMLNPAVVVALPWVLVWLWRRMRAGDVRAGWLLAFAIPLPAYLVPNSLWIQVKINWLTPAHVALLLGVALWWTESGVRERQARWLRVGAWFLLLVPALLPLAPLIRLVPQGRGATWSGWTEFGAAVQRCREQARSAPGSPGVFVFCLDYKDAAQLTHALKVAAGPAAATVLAQNVVGDSALQFDYWIPPAREIGKDAVMLLPRPDQRTRLVGVVAEHFDRIEKIERIHIRPAGIEVLAADVYLCHGYLGPDS